MLTSKSSLSYVLCCNLVNFSHRMESKVSFGIKILWAIQWQEFLCMCSRTRENNKNKVGPMIWDTLYHTSFTFSWILKLSVLKLKLRKSSVQVTSLVWHLPNSHPWPTRPSLHTCRWEHYLGISRQIEEEQQ